MGEIPDEMHKKINYYNKTSDRPLNVSKAIEICITKAVQKIDAELIENAAETPDDKKILHFRQKEYDALYNDVKSEALCPKILQKCAYQYILNNIIGEDVLYEIVSMLPIDKVAIDKNPERISFYAKDVLGFAIYKENDSN
jgi:hypothetical protein